MKVSVICTVLNEGKSIHKLLDSLARQTRQPDEIVFVDGGSVDDTVSILETYTQAHELPARVIVAAGANISRGRNIAIDAAAGPIIASTDAGVRLDSGWLAELLKPFEIDPRPNVVSGFFVPDPQSAFEVAMGTTVLPSLVDINPVTFLPSSRSVAFFKSAWEAAGRYPEWLDFCEDLILGCGNLRVPLLLLPKRWSILDPAAVYRLSLSSTINTPAVMANPTCGVNGMPFAIPRIW